jgi:hypothetical protein
MKKNLFTMMASMLFLAAPAQREALKGSGAITNKTYNLQDFEQLEFRRLSGKITVVAGKPFSVEISIDDNLADLLSVQVTAGNLVIELKQPPTGELYIEDSHIKIMVTLPALTLVKHTGNSDIKLSGLEGRSFHLIQSGNGDALLEGSIDELDINKSGNGDLHAEALKAADIRILKSGNGDTFIQTDNVFRANGSGNGDIINKGTGKPAADSYQTGNGKIRIKGEKTPSRLIP